MTSRLIAFLVILGFVAALALGALAVFAAVGASADVVSARMDQERAKADQARALAAQEWARADAWRLAVPEVALGLRWLYLGGGIAAAVLLVGGALALVAWLNVRSLVVYPNADGHYPVLVHRQFGGGLRVLDTSRGFGPVTLIGADGAVALPVGASEQAQLQIATQAQAAAALVGIASKSQSAPGDVVERASTAAAGLPAPKFNASEGARLVYVKQPGDANSEAARDLQDVREFIEGGANVRGFSRRSWLGYRFRSGHECTRGRYDALIDKLKRAGVIAADGSSWALAVSVSEALDAFGVGDLDSTDDA